MHIFLCLDQKHVDVMGHDMLLSSPLYLRNDLLEAMFKKCDFNKKCNILQWNAGESVIESRYTTPGLSYICIGNDIIESVHL